MRNPLKIFTLPIALTLVASPSFAQGQSSVSDKALSFLNDGLAFAKSNHMLVAGALGAAILLLAVRSILGRRADKAPDVLAIHSLVAMSQVAIADGRIGDTEVHQIAHILTRLTGTSYGPDQVMEMLQRLNPSTKDLEQVGKDLSEKDRQIVLEAALNIAVADGEIRPNEYAVVSELAQRMRIGADQFRDAMTRIAAHMQVTQPV